jgi:5-methylcytosine-specific restriction enzyme subunit McrC
MILLFKKEFEEIENFDFDKMTRKVKSIEGFPVNLEPDKDNGKILGLHLEELEDDKLELTEPKQKLKLKVSYFVGVVRLYKDNEKELILCVQPKIDNLDAKKMFLEVLFHPVVRRYVTFGKTYFIDVAEQKIEFKEPEKYTEFKGPGKEVDFQVPLQNLSSYMLFLVLHYLRVLRDLIRRGLQKGYVQTEENLNGRVKGKIIVKQNLKRNFPKAKLHYCCVSYQAFTVDTLENRILKAAFIKAKNFLSGFLGIFSDENLAPWIGEISRTFESVTTMRVYPSSFRLLNVQRIRKDYEVALNLAKVILKSLGYDPEVSMPGTSQITIYPYWINMNELFERYCEVKLVKGDISCFINYQVFPGYEDRNIEIDKGKLKLRPDFILINKNGDYAIADAKYKSFYNEDAVKREFKEDLQQIALYGRLCKEILEKQPWIHKKKLNEIEPELYILYPCEEEEISEIEGFRGIYKVGIPVPKKKIEK